MASDDFSGVSVALSAANFPAGALMTLTVSGQNSHTSDDSTTHETVTVSAIVRSAGGGTTTLSTPPVDVTHTTPGVATLEDVTIVSVTDSGGRSWTLAVDGKSATAVA